MLLWKPLAVKLKLLYAYCSSLYGCELGALRNKNIDTVCVAWRKALRICSLIHIATFCLNCLMLSLYSMSYANEYYLLLLRVFIVTVTLLKRLLLSRTPWVTGHVVTKPFSYSTHRQPRLPTVRERLWSANTRGRRNVLTGTSSCVSGHGLG